MRRRLRKTANETRFEFGENWQCFLARISEERIREAERSLKSLVEYDDLRGLTFLDVGCGSGLFSLAARRLGARVRSFDYDRNSVACAQALRARYSECETDWQIEQGSVLDHDYVKSLGIFDIVYSWGVLHHTGAMFEAIEQAAKCVKLGGLFALALYRKTRLCGAWKREKRWYSAASPQAQAAARRLFITLLRARFLAKGQSFGDYVSKYRSRRGMDFETDVHDWLGGYPYESILRGELEDFMRRRGFAAVQAIAQPYSTGMFGSGCDEFVYRRVPGTVDV